MADRWALQAAAVFLGLLAWDADPGVIAAAEPTAPSWRVADEGAGLKLEAPAAAGARLVLRCDGAAPDVWLLTLSRAGLDGPDAQAARDGLLGLTLTDGAAPVAAAAGRTALTREAVELRVRLPREGLARLASAGPGARLQLAATLGAQALLGGPEQPFPTAGLAAGLARLGRACA